MTTGATPAQSSRIAQYEGSTAVVLPMYTETGLPSVAYEGQLVIDSDTHGLRYYDANGGWQGVVSSADTRIYTGPDAPPDSGLFAGDLWYNTGNATWYTWDSNAALWTPGRGISLTVSDPSTTGSGSLEVGTIWVDKSTVPPTVKYWNGTSWVAAGVSGAPTTHVTATMPTSAAVGDTWVDTGVTPWQNYVCIVAYSSGGSIAVNWQRQVAPGHAFTYGTSFPASANLGDTYIDVSSAPYVQYTCVASYSSSPTPADWARVGALGETQLREAAAGIASSTAALAQALGSAALGESLVYNSDFSLGQTGWTTPTTGATYLFFAGSGAVTGDGGVTVTAPSGSGSVALAQDGAFLIPVTGDTSESYYISVSAKLASSSPGAGTVTVTATSYDATGTLISSSTPINTAALAADNVAHLFTGYFTPPSNARQVQITLTLNNATVNHTGPYTVGYINVKRAITADMLAANLVLTHELQQYATYSGVTSGVDIKSYNSGTSGAGASVSIMSDIANPTHKAIVLASTNGLTAYNATGGTAVQIGIDGTFSFNQTQGGGQSLVLDTSGVLRAIANGGNNTTKAVVIDPATGIYVYGNTSGSPAFQAKNDGTVQITTSGGGGSTLSIAGGLIEALLSGGSYNSTTGNGQSAVVMDPAIGLLMYGPTLGSPNVWLSSYDGHAYFYGPMSINGSTSIGGSLTVTGAVSLQSTLTMTGGGSITGGSITGTTITGSVFQTANGGSGYPTTLQLGQLQFGGGSGAIYSDGNTITVQSATMISGDTHYIQIGSSAINFGGSHVSPILQLFGNSSGNNVVSQGILNTTSTGVNVQINTSNAIMSKPSSGLKYKVDVHPLEHSNIQGGDILAIKPIRYRDRHEVEMHARGSQEETDWSYEPRWWIGWSAEDFIAAGWEELVTRDENGEPGYLHYDRVVPVLAMQVGQKLASIEARLAAAGL